MRRARAFVRRVRGMFGRDRADAEFAAELESHLQLHIDDNVRAGLSPEQARRAARVKFGAVEAIREQYRDRARFPVIDAFGRDLAFGFRALRRRPAFACAAVMTLALGIGANAAVLSVVDAVLLRPLPYRAPERIVRVKGPSTQSFVRFSEKAGSLAIRPDLLASPAFSAMAFFLSGAANLGGEPAERIRGAEVTAEFFDVLDVLPQLGRTFSAAEVQRTERLVVISDRLWRDRFHADPGALGRSVLLDGVLFSLIGVMPPAVDFPDASRVWVPNGSPTQIGGMIPAFTVVARVKDGVSFRDAMRDAAGRSGLKGEAISKAQLVPLREVLVGAVRPVAMLVWAAAGLVLLIACMNTANLLLARVASREREFALRRAIGATRGRLVRQVLAESFLLACLASVAALPVTYWTLESIGTLLPATLHGVERISLDGRVLAATACLSLVTAGLFGLAPALSTRRRTSADVLRGAAVTSVDRFWGRFRSALLVGEVAVGLVLLVAAVTLVGTVRQILAVDSGVRGDRALAIELSLPRSSYAAPERKRRFHQDLEVALRRVPGVEAVGLTNELPGRAGSLLAEDVRLQGIAAKPVDQREVAVRLTATPGYFAAAGIDLIAGRYFTDRDTDDAPRVVIVSEGYARLAGVAPAALIGARAASYDRRRDGQGWAEIVGVVRDVRMRGPEAKFVTALYVPDAVGAGVSGPSHLVVRASGDPLTLVPSIRAVVTQLDATIPLYNIQTFEQVQSALLADRRFAMVMMVTFATLGFVLAIVGLYGVISYLVQVRTREIGIRLAIGASRSAIRRQILTSGAAHAGVGIVLGLALNLAAFGAVASRVPALSNPDPAVIGGVVALMVVVALAATWFPAARATRIDPAITLRTE